MLDPIYEAIAWLLSKYYEVVPNLGVAIILLTFTIMLILYPLTAKQAKSMIAMQRLQPEIKRIQAKHKQDRAKMNEEVMKVYQENKVNPLAGCLPLLVQLPIFFSLFNVLRDAYKYVPKGDALFHDLCHGFDRFCGADLTNKIRESPLVTGDLSGLANGDTVVHHLQFLSMDLQKSATDVGGGFFTALPYFVLVLLVMLTGFLQTRQAQKRTPQANKQMATVMKVLPVFFGLISLQFPAGLVLYFFVSNLWRLGQQEVIFRRHGSGTIAGTSKGAIDVDSKERPTKGSRTEVLEAGPGADAPEADAPAVDPPGARSKSASRPVPTARRQGGLRGLFQLPPPETNGGTGGSARPAAGKGAGAKASTPPKPPPQRKRRSNKKKRKR